MSSVKKMQNIIIADLLEQVQRIDKLIAMYSSPPIDKVAEFMIKQNDVRRQAFVDQLNPIFNKFAMSVVFTPIAQQAKVVESNEPVSFAFPSIKKVPYFKIVDLLEQVQKVDRQIAMYHSLDNAAVAESMILQYSVMRQEFVDKLNEITQQFSMSIELYPNAQKRPSSPKKYAIVDSPLSMANESGVEYKP